MLSQKAMFSKDRRSRKHTINFLTCRICNDVLRNKSSTRDSLRNRPSMSQRHCIRSLFNQSSHRFSCIFYQFILFTLLASSTEECEGFWPFWLLLVFTSLAFYQLQLCSQTHFPVKKLNCLFHSSHHNSDKNHMHAW